jgi:hypothetical protein
MSSIGILYDHEDGGGSSNSSSNDDDDNDDDTARVVWSRLCHAGLRHSYILRNGKQIGMKSLTF